MKTISTNVMKQVTWFVQLAQPSTVFSTDIIPQLFPTFLLKPILRLRQTGIQKTCTTLMRVTENHLI